MILRPILNSGILFVLIGIAFVFKSSDYKIGDLSSIGPGYFPTILGLILILLGIINILKSIILREVKIYVNFAYAPLFFVLSSNILFGLLIEPYGLIIATFVLIFISSLAIRNVKRKETFMLSIVLTAMCIFIFILGLSMPINLYPKF